MKVQEGLVVFCDTLRWNDGWEFECPSMMLSPVIRCFETGAHHEQIVEDVLIDAIVGGEFVSQSFEQQWGWRGYNLRTLQRRFYEALKGKRFPRANYTATREKIIFIKDEEGELTWKTI